MQPDIPPAFPPPSITRGVRKADEHTRFALQYFQPSLGIWFIFEYFSLISLHKHTECTDLSSDPGLHPGIHGIWGGSPIFPLARSHIQSVTGSLQQSLEINQHVSYEAEKEGAKIDKKSPKTSISSLPLATFGKKAKPTKTPYFGVLKTHYQDCFYTTQSAESSFFFSISPVAPQELQSTRRFFSPPLHLGFS